MVVNVNVKNHRSSLRDLIYDKIDSEREYQEALWGPTETQGKHSITEFIAFIEDYLGEAKHILVRKRKVVAYPETLEIMRKVAALTVACMEQNGSPSYRTVPNGDRLEERSVKGK